MRSIPNATQFRASQSMQERTESVVSRIYRQTASRAESSFTRQEALTVALSMLDMTGGNYKTFDTADELIKYLKSDID